jgi:hypothetical protein
MAAPTWHRTARAQYAELGGAIFVVNGQAGDNAQVWDGVEGGNVYNLGELPPDTKATVATDGLTPGTLSGTYRYYYTYYRTGTTDMPAYESGRSPVSDDYTISGTEGINVGFTDPGGTTGFDMVRIYRQGGSLNEIYFVAAVATGTSPYDDQNADSVIAANNTLNTRTRVNADGLPENGSHILTSLSPTRTWSTSEPPPGWHYQGT